MRDMKEGRKKKKEEEKKQNKKEHINKLFSFGNMFLSFYPKLEVNF